MDRIATRGRREHETDATPAAAIPAMLAGASRVPATATTSPTRTSPPRRPDARSDRKLTVYLDNVVLLDNYLHLCDCVGSLRDDGSRRDGDRLAFAERPGERRARRRLADDAQRSRQVGGAHGVAVHRRARERREIHGRPHILGQDTAGGGPDLHRLCRQRMCRGEDPRLRLFEGE